MAPKKGKRIKSYTKDELELLMSVEDSAKSYRDLAIILGRSAGALRKKRWDMTHPNYGKESTARYREISNEKSDMAHLNQRWTKAEEDFILAQKKMTDSELAAKLGRTRGAVQVKRLRLMENKKRRA
jgi:hypothetical protein